MRSKSIVRHRIFGKDADSTIYYLVGYGGTLRRYRPHLHALERAGFRVFAFEYDKAILDDGDPKLLVDSLDEIVELVNKDKKTHKVGGVYGVSLGSWLGANVLVRCNIQTGMFNTGAVSLVKIVSESHWFQAGMSAFLKNGHTRDSLEKAWGRHEFPPEGRRWEGKRALIMSSSADRIMDINEVWRNVSSWKKAGDDVTLIVSRGLGHGPVIVRNMFRIPKTVNFFKHA